MILCRVDQGTSGSVYRCTMDGRLHDSAEWRMKDDESIQVNSHGQRIGAMWSVLGLVQGNAIWGCNFVQSDNNEMLNLFS